MQHDGRTVGRSLRVRWFPREMSFRPPLGRPWVVTVVAIFIGESCAAQPGSNCRGGREQPKGTANADLRGGRQRFLGRLAADPPGYKGAAVEEPGRKALRVVSAFLRAVSNSGRSSPTATSVNFWKNALAERAWPEASAALPAP